MKVLFYFPNDSTLELDLAAAPGTGDYVDFGDVAEAEEFQAENTWLVVRSQTSYGKGAEVHLEEPENE